jgi:hypothetical protein
MTEKTMGVLPQTFKDGDDRQMAICFCESKEEKTTFPCDTGFIPFRFIRNRYSEKYTEFEMKSYIRSLLTEEDGYTIQKIEFNIGFNRIEQLTRTALDTYRDMPSKELRKILLFNHLQLVHMDDFIELFPLKHPYWKEKQKREIQQSVNYQLKQIS